MKRVSNTESHYIACPRKALPEATYIPWLMALAPSKSAAQHLLSSLPSAPILISMMTLFLPLHVKAL